MEHSHITTDSKSLLIPKRAVPQWLQDIDRLLRGDATQVAVLKARGIDVADGGVGIAILLLGLVYGACMGFFTLLRGDSSWLLQFISGMVKVPMLFVLTLLVTFPSLYVFNALMGSRLSGMVLWRLLTSSTAVTMAVLASFGPVVAFFSLSTTSYSFMLLLNVLMFGVSGFLGLKFLLQTLHRIAHTLSIREVEVTPPVLNPDPANAGALETVKGQTPVRQTQVVFRIWIIVFGLVGAQMSWVLRPFLGSPNEPFAILRSRESNFFQAVWQHLTNLFS
ncbi:MAG: hypothetical protein AB1813_25805 [Verrucomicrobiota bacterium]|jgi:hypothetical protein